MSKRLIVSVHRQTLRKCRAKCEASLTRAASAARAELQANVEIAAKAGRDLMPAATGQSQDAVKAIQGQLVGDVFTTGVMVERTPNDQAVLMEIGGLSPHRTMEEHDADGRKCSSGYPGGWGDEYEQADVRATRPMLRANAAATPTPIGKAVVRTLGRIIRLEDSKGFRRGVVNMYSGTTLRGTMLRDKLVGVIRSALGPFGAKPPVGVLLILLLSAASVFAGAPPSKWDQASYNYPFASEAVLNGGSWYHSDVIGIGPQVAGSNSPTLWQLYMHLIGWSGEDPATPGLPSLTGYITTGRYNTATDFIEWQDGDTVWFIGAGEAIADTGKWSVKLFPPGGDYMQLHLYNSGDSVAVVQDSSFVWGIHN